MKKIILITSLFITSLSFSQEHKWFIGGGVNGNINSSNYHDGVTWRAQWNLSPEIGFYRTERTQYGLNLDLGEQLTRSGGHTSHAPRVGAGVFGRYLFGTTNFHPFLGVRASYLMNGTGWGHLANGAMNSSIIMNAGVLYNINSRFTFFGSFGAFGYTSTRVNSSNGEDLVNRNLGINFNSIGERFTIGLYYNFGKSLN